MKFVAWSGSSPITSSSQVSDFDACLDTTRFSVCFVDIPAPFRGPRRSFTPISDGRLLALPARNRRVWLLTPKTPFVGADLSISILKKS